MKNNVFPVFIDRFKSTRVSTCHFIDFDANQSVNVEMKTMTQTGLAVWKVYLAICGYLSKAESPDLRLVVH